MIQNVPQAREPGTNLVTEKMLNLNWQSNLSCHKIYFTTKHSECTTQQQAMQPTSTKYSI